MLKHCALIAGLAFAACGLSAPAPGQWLEEDKLLAGDGTEDDWFGEASISGNTIVVGAYGDDDHGDNSGSAYVFRRGGVDWVQVAKLVASDGAPNDRFGRSVSICGDTIVVSADGDDDNGGGSGSVYVFVEPVGGWSGTVNEDAKLLPSDAAEDDYFGRSAAVCGDTVVVGAYWDDDNGNQSGSAYVFVRPAGGWLGTLNEDAKLLASDAAAGDWFGHRVSVAGDAVTVGAYRDDDSGNQSGSAYVFVRPAGGWLGTLNEDAKLLASDAAAGDSFGWSVHASEAAVVIGAVNDEESGSDVGSAYVFERPAGGWSGTLNESAKLLASDGADFDLFGDSVSISGDTVVVGALLEDAGGDDSGSAYVFQRPLDGWSGRLTEDAKLLASDGAPADYLGDAVSVSGNTIVASAYHDDDNGDDSGSAYVFAFRPIGDLNCDGAVNLFDIDPFVLALTSAGNADPFDDYYTVWPDCDPLLADVNADGSVNLFDIDPFVELLTS